MDKHKEGGGIDEIVPKCNWLYTTLLGKSLMKLHWIDYISYCYTIQNSSTIILYIVESSNSLTEISNGQI